MADEIWICEKQRVTKWEGDILTYKDHLKSKVMKDSNQDARKRGLDKSARGNWWRSPAAADADADPFVFSTHDNLARAAILFFSSTNKLFWFFWAQNSSTFAPLLGFT